MCDSIIQPKCIRHTQILSSKRLHLERMVVNSTNQEAPKWEAWMLCVCLEERRMDKSLPALSLEVPCPHYRGLLAAFLTARLSSDLSLDSFSNSISSFLSQNVLNHGTTTPPVFIASILPFKYQYSCFKNCRPPDRANHIF